MQNCLGNPKSARSNCVSCSNRDKPRKWAELTEEYACRVFQAGRNMEKKNASNGQRDLIQRPHKAEGNSSVIIYALYQHSYL